MSSDCSPNTEGRTPTPDGGETPQRATIPRAGGRPTQELAGDWAQGPASRPAVELGGAGSCHYSHCCWGTRRALGT
eukprot:8957374-Pyramimonas_sp.AAC.1